MALGKSGADFEQEQVAIAMLGLPMLEAGLPLDFDEAEARRRFETQPEIILQADLGCGQGAATIWTCDLTHDYISINGDYRS
jgi:glutamate N-acetyltransferase/amino-acid N-acetyltransferase